MCPISVCLIFLVSPLLIHSEDVFAPEADKLSCSPEETPCGPFCCPYSHGSCCWDDLGCCPQGKTCIDILGIGVCVGVERDKNNNFTITSERPAGPRYETTKCPPKTTDCGKGMCCPLVQAVCCSDGMHCCPRGYKCGPDSCIKRTEVPVWKQIRSDMMNLGGNEDSLKECPGRSCPKEASCCLDDNEEWSCCPKSAAGQTRHAIRPEKKVQNGKYCCYTSNGEICCPAGKICTRFGCL